MNAELETSNGRHRAVIQFLKDTAAEISSRALSDIHSLEEWRRQRPALHGELLSMLGLDPFPERTPLQAQITGVLDRPSYRIENLVFQSLPSLYVTGNLYLPQNGSQPLPTVLYVCGHSPHPLGAKIHYQDRGAWFASHGYVCLVLDTLEFGEVAGIHHGIHDLNMWNWLSLGYTPVGVEVWNAIRALDYLQSRPETDGERIGMTGISGGGAVTWFTAAADERITAAVPVCSTYTFGSQAAHWVASGQCDCIYFNNTFLSDLPVTAALIAPRPLLICSGRKDIDFPPDGYHEVYERAKRVYELYGCPEHIKEVDAAVGHEDAPLFRKESRQWMNLWLKNETASLPALPLPEREPEAAEDLACLFRLPEDAVNYHIHDRFIPDARLQEWTSPAAWQTRRAELQRELRAKVFRWFPKEPIPFETRLLSSDGGWVARYADYKDYVFLSEAGAPVRAQLLSAGNASAETPWLLYVKRAEDSLYMHDRDELLPLLGRYTVLTLNPRLTERTVAAEYAEIERTASWIGRTVAAMQIWDILRAVEWIMREAKAAPTSLALYGKGEMGIAALYAALEDERVSQVILRDPPSSHWQGAALLNILRITDLPETAALCAPRRLTFLREMPPAFDYTRRLYELQGQPDRIDTASSLPEALEIWKYDRRSDNGNR